MPDLHTDPLASLFNGDSLRRRFAVGVALMLLPMLVLGTASVWAYEHSVAAGNRIADKAISGALPIADLGSRLNEARDRAYRTVVRGEPLARYRAMETETDRAFISILARSEENTQADLKIAYRSWQEAKASFASVYAVTPLQAPLTGGPPRPVADPLPAFAVAINHAVAAAGRAFKQEGVDIGIEAAEVKALQREIELLLALTGLVTILAAVLIARRLSRSVIDPVVRLQEATRKLGGGDFSERVEVDRADEIGALALHFNAMAEDLQQHEADLRASQERLVQAQKMEAVGQLAGGIAHDFNNLLLVVGSYADLLGQSFEADDPRRDDAAEIGRAADRAAALTRQLLTFSRRDVVQPVPVDATVTIARLEEMLRRTLTASIDLRLELDPALRATVIDAGQLEQVVLNLVLNAQNAMPQGGELAIRTSAVEIGEEPPIDGLVPGSYVAIAVTDTGEGMSEDVRSRALEPFFTTRGDVGGSGLGLATVYGIVTGAGGAISLESGPGEGTTVMLYLPTTTEDVEAPPTEEEVPERPSERGDRTVVLVAEDEPTILALTSRMLSAQGYTVLAAASGSEALKLSRRTKRIDVLLTDVIMPGMTGRELARTLSSERPGLPVVYMSGYSNQIVAHGVLDPDTLYLPKPFKAQQLLELLELAVSV